MNENRCTVFSLKFYRCKAKKWSEITVFQNRPKHPPFKNFRVISSDRQRISTRSQRDTVLWMNPEVQGCKSSKMSKILWAQWASSLRASTPQLSDHISGTEHAIVKNQNGPKAVSNPQGARAKIGTTHQEFMTRACPLLLVPLPALLGYISGTAIPIVKFSSDPKRVSNFWDAKAWIKMMHQVPEDRAHLLLQVSCPQLSGHISATPSAIVTKQDGHRSLRCSGGEPVRIRMTLPALQVGETFYCFLLNSVLDEDEELNKVSILIGGAS